MSKFFKFSLLWRSWVKASNKTRKFSFYVMIKLVFISMIYFWEIDNGWLLPSFLLDAFKFTGMDKPALFWKVCFLDKQNKQTKVKMDPYQWVAILFNGHDTLKQIKKRTLFPFHFFVPCYPPHPAPWGFSVWGLPPSLSGLASASFRFMVVNVTFYQNRSFCGFNWFPVNSRIHLFSPSIKIVDTINNQFDCKKSEWWAQWVHRVLNYIWINQNPQANVF